MRPVRTKGILAAALVRALSAAGRAAAATAPSEPQRLPDASALIPMAPAPRPTATPTPRAIPEEEPVAVTPGDESVSGTCGEPFPPPVARFNVKVHSRPGDRVLLDATPLVGPDAAYCSQVGFTDGRSFCPVRTEGDPERQACEAARVGTRRRHRAVRTHVDRERRALRRGRPRRSVVREPLLQPVPGARLRPRHLPGLRRERGLRRDPAPLSRC